MVPKSCFIVPSLQNEMWVPCTEICSWSVLVHLTQIERALNSTVIMKIFCLFLVVLLCVSVIEARKKKTRGGGKNGGDNGNNNLGNSIRTSLLEGIISVLRQTNQRTVVNSIIKLAGWLGCCNFYVLETTYHLMHESRCLHECLL